MLILKVSQILLTFINLFQILKANDLIAEVLEISWNITNTDIVDMEWNIVHPSRGISALNFLLDIKCDINTDNIMTEADVYYSSKGISYVLTPYHSPKGTLTSLINWGYKTYVDETAKQCCTNTLEFDDVFRSPLTKRVVNCTNCFYPAKSIPPTMRLGFYRHHFKFTGDVDVLVVLLLKVDEE